MADGMGGLSLGAETAKCVCENLSEYIVQHIDEENMWQQAFKYADAKLRELSLANRCNMGVAVTALILTAWSYEFAWQGNVRLYIHRGNQLQQITTDHVMDIGYGHTMLTRCLKGRGLRDDVPNFSLPFYVANQIISLFFVLF